MTHDTRALMMIRGCLELDELITGKRVVIIGHAPMVLKTKRDIDAYDCVVRLNNGHPRADYDDYIGTRTDIWFSWDGWDKHYESISHLFNAKKWIKYKDYPRYYFPTLKSLQRQDKAPSMGMLAYYYIMQHNPKSVSLYGFDFFKTPDFNCPDVIIENQQNKCHNFKREEQWFWESKPSNVHFYDENNKEVKMVQKKISNKAIQEPRETKGNEIKCKVCGHKFVARVTPVGCPKCNSVNG